MFDELKLQFYCKCKKVNRILFYTEKNVDTFLKHL